MSGGEVRYSIVCQGKTRDDKTVICPGWGRWGSPDETCPKCGSNVKVAGSAFVQPLHQRPVEDQEVTR